MVTNLSCQSNYGPTSWSPKTSTRSSVVHKLAQLSHMHQVDVQGNQRPYCLGQHIPKGVFTVSVQWLKLTVGTLSHSDAAMSGTATVSMQKVSAEAFRDTNEPQFVSNSMIQASVSNTLLLSVSCGLRRKICLHTILSQAFSPKERGTDLFSLSVKADVGPRDAIQMPSAHAARMQQYLENEVNALTRIRNLEVTSPHLELRAVEHRSSAQ